MSNIGNTLLNDIFAAIDKEHKDKLILTASVNTIKADWFTLSCAYIFGAKTTQTNETGTYVIANFLGTLYMIERKQSAAEGAVK